MNEEEFRRNMNDYWDQVNEEARDFREPFIVDKRFRSLYRGLDGSERRMADDLIAEWVMSDDSPRRCFARDLIRKFKIVTALPALRNLAERLATARTGAEGLDELEILNWTISELEAWAATMPDG
jgi:hypothetical protein